MQNSAPASLAFLTECLDRAAHLRADPAALMALAQRPDACAYLISGEAALCPGKNISGAEFTMADARRLAAGQEAIFLGLDGEQPIFGLHVAREASEQFITDGLVSAIPLRRAAIEALLPPRVLSILAELKSLAHWHQRHQFCANCGQMTHITQAGWRRDCTACSAQHFPRTDPVVIMLVTDGERCLLGRQAAFMPGMWSCLAGFVEPGETIEEAVRREVMEETGIDCVPEVYVRSQPWPFPSSLMIGYRARARSSKIVIDPHELEDARWFDRAEVQTMATGTHPAGLTIPFPIAIAHHLLIGWLDEAVDACR